MLYTHNNKCRYIDYYRLGIIINILNSVPGFRYLYKFKRGRCRETIFSTCNIHYLLKTIYHQSHTLTIKKKSPKKYYFQIYNYYYLVDNGQPEKVTTDESKNSMGMMFDHFIDSFDVSNSKPCK